MRRLPEGTASELHQGHTPRLAEPLYEAFCEAVASHGVDVAHGVFGAHMQVTSVNDGPVTLLIDTP